jgi:hypothetical protein
MWESCKQGTKVYRKKPDPDDNYTVGIVHKVVRERGEITRLQVCWWRKDRKNGFLNRTVYVEDLTMDA